MLFNSDFVVIFNNLLSHEYTMDTSFAVIA